MWGLSDEQLKRFCSRDDLSAALADQLAVASSKEVFLFEHLVQGEPLREITLVDGRVFDMVSYPLSGDATEAGVVWNFRDITAAKQTEAALQRSEEKFSKLFDANPIWSELVTLDDGRFIEVNQAFLDVTGFRREEVIGATSAELALWPEDVDRADIVTYFDHNHRLDAFPCRFSMRDGQTRHFLWSAEAVMLEERRCLISSLLDVTIQHRMQQALLESEERYRSLYNNIPVGLFRTTPQGHILSANPALVNLFGYDSEKSFLAQSPSNLYARPDVRQRMIEGLDSEGATSWEAVEFRREDGSTFWATLNATKITDHDGQFLYLDGVIQEVTERVLAERALRASESKYRLLVDHAHDGIFISRDGRVLFANPSTCRIFGYTHAEIMAKPLEDLVHPDDVNMVMTRHRARLAGEDPLSHYTFRARRKSGETLYHRTPGGPCRLGGATRYSLHCPGYYRAAPGRVKPSRGKTLFRDGHQQPAGRFLPLR